MDNFVVFYYLILLLNKKIQNTKYKLKYKKKYKLNTMLINI